MDVLYDETGREVGRSCLKKVAPAVAPIAAAAPVAAAAAAAVASTPAAAPVAAAPVAAAATSGAGWGWLKWLLLGLLGLLALWGLSKCFAKPVPVATQIDAPPIMVACWNGTEARKLSECPAKETCWDGSFATSLSACPVEPAPEPEPMPEPEPTPIEPVQTVMGSIDRVCGPNAVTLFDVQSYQTPKSVSYLGSNPQFGDSHGLTPSQFYDKLNSAYSFGGSDRAFLNYMARSLGYNSFRSMDASMFSEATLNRGEKGLLGFGSNHALQYSSLDTNARDREAFRVKAANGTDVHFMKTCGNFMYVCQ